MTGVEFNQKLDLTIDRAYSRYWSTGQRNELIRQAIIKALSIKDASNDNIRNQSNLFGIYKSNVVFTPASNTLEIDFGGAGISDYYDFENIKCKFIENCGVATGRSVYIVQASNSTPLRIQLSVGTNLRTKSQVNISGVTGNTNANGNRYLNMIGNNWYELYSDENLLTPIVGNGTYSGTSGSIQIVKYNYAKDLHSNQKYSKLNEATTDNPLYEIADGVVKIYPLGMVCSEVSVDYISTPVFIDVTDGVTDILLTYSERFVYFIIDKTAMLMGQASRDMELTQNSIQEINQP